jgi:hypothetical protein
LNAFFAGDSGLVRFAGEMRTSDGATDRRKRGGGTATKPLGRIQFGDELCKVAGNERVPCPNSVNGINGYGRLPEELDVNEGHGVVGTELDDGLTGAQGRKPAGEVFGVVCGSDGDGGFVLAREDDVGHEFGQAATLESISQQWPAELTAIAPALIQSETSWMSTPPDGITWISGKGPRSSET